MIRTMTALGLGVRAGSPTRPEAGRLRRQFVQLADLERTYRRGGLTLRERSELAPRLDALAARIRIEKRDRQACR